MEVAVAGSGNERARDGIVSAAFRDRSGTPAAGRPIQEQLCTAGEPG